MCLMYFVKCSIYALRLSVTTYIPKKGLGVERTLHYGLIHLEV